MFPSMFLFQGGWKCHLSKTDVSSGILVEDIRDEAKTDLVVAVDVSQLSIHLSSWFDEDIDEESTATVGDEITITCSFENPDEVYPIPRMQLKMLDDDKESLLTESIMNEKKKKIYISRNVTREDKYVLFTSAQFS